MKDKNILENINFEEYYKTHSPGYVIEVYKNEIIQEFILGNKLTNPITVETRYDTLYDIASLTKTFTSVLVYMAYEENRIDINETIYNLDNEYENLKDIRVIDLLSHNQNIWTDGYLGGVNSKEEFLRILHTAYVKEKRPTYVDTHYIILGLLLERIYNKSFERLCQEKIFDVLGMKDTTFNPDPSRCASNNYEHTKDGIVEDIHPGLVHDTKGRVGKQLGMNLGHASIFTTGKDMMIFLQTFLNNKLLKEETLSFMLEHRNTNETNYEILKSINEEQDINETFNELRKENPSYSLPRTYNNMGTRYRNNIKAMNDIPTKASNKSILFSGYTGPMYVIDFENNIIILVMCNIIHNSKLDRETRKSITVKIIDQIFDNIM